MCNWQGCERHGEPQISRFALLQHLRRHTREKPYLCTLPDCGARFSRIDNLQKHWNAHGEGKVRQRPGNVLAKDGFSYVDASIDALEATAAHSTSTSQQTATGRKRSRSRAAMDAAADDDDADDADEIRMVKLAPFAAPGAVRASGTPLSVAAGLGTRCGRTRFSRRTWPMPPTRSPPCAVSAATSIAS